MQDKITLPTCFSGERPMEDPASAGTKSAQSLVMSIYQAKIAGQHRSITVTWCKNLLFLGLSISFEGGKLDDEFTCKVELKPWYFWRKHGSKRFFIDDTEVGVYWDLKTAKFGGEPEPTSDYYVAIVCQEEVILLIGDLKKEAYRRTSSPPSLFDAILISKREHIFSKKKFSTRAQFHGRGKFHEISIECSSSSGMEQEMVIKVDGHLAIQVQHLQWKFRVNESISIDELGLEVYWDVHDWIFSPGLRHALFVFKSISSNSSSETAFSDSKEEINGGGSSEFCLFLYAWKLD